MSSSESEEEVQFTFTEQQLVILHEEKDSYRDTNKKLRQKKVNEIFKRMKIMENEDKDFNSKKDVVQGVSRRIQTFSPSFHCLYEGYFSMASTVCLKEDRGKGFLGAMDVEKSCWNRT